MKAIVAVAFAALILPQLAAAEPTMTVGATLALTGPAAVLGNGANAAIRMMPDHVGNVAVKYIVLDDASDVTNAVVNVNKLISQYHVDVILGPATSPQSLAALDPASEGQTPMLAFGSSRFIVEPQDAKRRWVFKTNPSDGVYVHALIENWKQKGIKSVAFLGFDDAYGESILTELQAQLLDSGIKLTPVERFGSRDLSVAAQALKVMAARPEAVVIAASGTPALLPETTLRDRGYRGPIYQNNPAATAEFLRNGGARVEGTYVVTGPCLVYEQLPADHPVRTPCGDFVGRYEAANGPGSRSLFAYQAYDAWSLLSRAVPVAAAAAMPGTAAFRVALRDALEATHEVPGDGGVFTMSPTDHVGLDSRAAAIVTVENGKWKLSQ